MCILIGFNTINYYVWGVFVSEYNKKLKYLILHVIIWNPYTIQYKTRIWNVACNFTQKECFRFFADTEPVKKETCAASCYTYNSCENCTSNQCMWCGSQQRCVETNSYVASFLYGQCKEWVTGNDKCTCESTLYEFT